MEDVKANLPALSKDYPLLRDSSQLVRVNLLQYLWKEILGFQLHPNIPTGDIKRVADLGTASGLWLCDLQKTMPSIERLNGFDISSDSFTIPRDLPKSVSLHVLDMTGPVSDKHKGKYDVVHLRLVRPAILHGDPSAVISHIFDLLRPGGYVQWEEYDNTEMANHIEPDVPQPSNLERLAQMLALGETEWVRKLPQIFESKGMKSVAVVRRHTEPHHRLLMSYLICHTIREVTYGNFDVNGPPGLGDTVRAQCEAALKEALKGSYVGYIFQAVVAQKPL